MIYKVYTKTFNLMSKELCPPNQRGVCVCGGGPIAFGVIVGGAGVTVYLDPLGSLTPGGQDTPGYLDPRPGYLNPQAASIPYLLVSCLQIP